MLSILPDVEKMLFHPGFNKKLAYFARDGKRIAPCGLTGGSIYSRKRLSFHTITGVGRMFLMNDLDLMDDTDPTQIRFKGKDRDINLKVSLEDYQGRRVLLLSGAIFSTQMFNFYDVFGIILFMLAHPEAYPKLKDLCDKVTPQAGDAAIAKVAIYIQDCIQNIYRGKDPLGITALAHRSITEEWFPTRKDRLIMPMIPFEKDDVKAYLDERITFWRKEMAEADASRHTDKTDLCVHNHRKATCYINAYQSVRVALFGEKLP